MPETITPQLSESEVKEIAIRPPGAMNVVTVERILLTPAERDALIRDWRALRAANERLRISDDHNYQLWLSLKERHAHKFYDANGQWADTCQQCGVTTGDDHDGYDCIAWLQRQNAALREQLAQARAAAWDDAILFVKDRFGDSANARVVDIVGALQDAYANEAQTRASNQPER